MLRLPLTVSFSLLICCVGIASAEGPMPAPKPRPAEITRPAGSSKPRVKGPVTVTSETLTADNQAHTALFERNVVARTTDMMMSADWMLVHYSDPGGEITRIESKGNVKVQKEDKVITSGEAVYFTDSPERIVFTGSPRAFDGQNTVSGTKITYYIDGDRSFVEGSSKVIMKSRQDK